MYNERAMAEVLILVGSATLGSRSLHLGQAIGTELEKLGTTTEVIDLLALQLPSFDVTTEQTKAYDAKTQAFLDKSKKAKAFVWVTPVYHNSFSSLLKMALDWQHFFMDGKVVGLASHGGDRSPAAVDQLLMLTRAQHLVTIPTRACTANSDYDDQKQLINGEIKERITLLSRQLVDFIKRFSS